MANLVITSTTNTIKVVFNDTPFNDLTGHILTKGTWKKSAILNVKLNEQIVKVEVQSNSMLGGHWNLSHTATDGAFIVDSVDGVVPTSLSDLYNKISALIE